MTRKQLAFTTAETRRTRFISTTIIRKLARTMMKKKQMKNKKKVSREFLNFLTKNYLTCHINKIQWSSTKKILNSTMKNTNSITAQ
jgi:hypothetical protein